MRTKYSRQWKTNL